MVNVIFLVIVFSSNYNNGTGAAVSIPQANMKQCQINVKNYEKEKNVQNIYCIAGVK